MNQDSPRCVIMYQTYLSNLNFYTNHHSLYQKGVTGINDLTYPHIFDLEDIRHREDIHRMFVYVATNTPNYIA